MLELLINELNFLVKLDTLNVLLHKGLGGSLPLSRGLNNPISLELRHLLQILLHILLHNFGLSMVGMSLANL